MQDKNNIVNWLGYGGLVPFVGLTILGWVNTFPQEIITKLHASHFFNIFIGTFDVGGHVTDMIS